VYPNRCVSGHGWMDGMWLCVYHSFHRILPTPFKIPPFNPCSCSCGSEYSERDCLFRQTRGDEGVRHLTAGRAGVCECERALRSRNVTWNEIRPAVTAGCIKKRCMRYIVATYRCWAMTLTNGMIRADRLRGRRPMQHESQAAMTAARGGLSGGNDYRIQG